MRALWIVLTLALAGCQTPIAGHLYDGVEVTANYNNMPGVDASIGGNGKYANGQTRISSGGHGGGVGVRILLRYDRGVCERAR